jgi:ATP-binding cassette, subfamily C (CFTR/MRP), member 1
MLHQNYLQGSLLVGQPFTVCRLLSTASKRRWVKLQDLVFSFLIYDSDLWPLPPERETKSLSDGLEKAFYERCPPKKRPRHLRNGDDVSASVSAEEKTDDLGSQNDDSERKETEVAQEEKSGKQSGTAAGNPDSSPYDESLPKALYQQYFFSWWLAGILDFSSRE